MAEPNFVELKSTIRFSSFKKGLLNEIETQILISQIYSLFLPYKMFLIALLVAFPFVSALRLLSLPFLFSLLEYFIGKSTQGTYCAF